MYSLSSAPKQIQLWISTRKTNPILSDPEYPLDQKTINEIKELSGFTISKSDQIYFPKVLKKFSPYTEKLFRGIFKSDILYLELQKSNIVVTKRYYSFSKNLFVAKEFGDKIVFSLVIKNNFDISKYSREGEVILDKGVQLKKVSQIDNYQNQGFILIQLEQVFDVNPK
jgi:hypothetical protein